MTEVEALLQLHDMDVLLGEIREPRAAGRLKKLGFSIPDPTPVERLRNRLFAGVDRRWQNHYDRALKRYGRGIAVVRDRVCMGCFITLPTSVSPGMLPSLTLCECCGRILYWPEPRG